MDVDVDDRIAVLIRHVWRRRHTPVTAQPALAAKGPAVVGDVLLRVPVHCPSVVGEVPAVVAWLVLMKQLHPTRRVTDRPPEIPLNISLTILLTRFCRVPLKRLPLRV